MVDIEQRALGAFGDDPLPLLERLVEEEGGVGDVLVDLRSNS